MKLKPIIALMILSLFVIGCQLKEDTTDNVIEPVETNQDVTLSGTVLDHVTSKPMTNVIVRIPNMSTETSSVTDMLGKYNFTIKIQTAMSISVIAEKEGYESDTTSINIAPGKNVEMENLRLRQKSGDLPVVSDKAASIYLINQSTEKLGIKESGDIETALATFQVIDSTGIPINGSRAVEISFRIIAGPNGGEFLYPTKLKTNENGQATTSITAGNKAGVIQIEALITKGTITIRSKPIFFTIYGGFPVQERFAVAAEKLNYSFWGMMNREIPFTALLGDKYSNPVRPNTAVYFNTTDGVIGNFKYTEILGRATSVLATFGYPNHTVYGPGFFVVTAQTSTEEGNIITTSTLRLLSGNPIISNVLPSSFALINAGSQTFTFTVLDQNNNPISSEYTISIAAEGAELSVTPSTFKIPDSLTGGPGISQFVFTVGDAKPDEIKASSAAVIITISGPRGTFSYTINGTAL